MFFRTKLPIPAPDFEINHREGVFCMGSCFSEHMHNKLQHYKFRSLLNPFGTLFHPPAIENALLRICMREKYTEQEIYHYNDLFFSWDHSTRFSSGKMPHTLSKINQQIDEANDFLKTAHVFLFTLGTAWAYSLKKGDFLVSNCHKVPQQNFSKSLLSVAHVYKSIKNICAICKDINPDAKVIFSLSPVRHIRDGFVENNQSKATLHLALKDLMNDKLPQVFYFPSYEIVLDELRDYRFFKEDMLHPNDLATNYIWEKFSTTFFNEKTRQLNLSVQKIKQAIAHKPINPESLQHRKFLYDTLKKINHLSVEFPTHTFDPEIEILKHRMQNVY